MPELVFTTCCGPGCARLAIGRTAPWCHKCWRRHTEEGRRWAAEQTAASRARRKLKAAAS
jgi:hypothetical protein